MIKKLLAGIAFSALTFPASATVVFEDHFDDGVLQGWSSSLDHASGVTYVESGTNLTVTDIEATTTNTYARARFERYLGPLTDFSSNIQISWDSDGSLAAMQNLYIELSSATSGVIARVGYNDAWVNESGAISANIGTDIFFTGFSSLGLSGAAFLEIERVGADISIHWNGTNVLNGIDNRLVTHVAMSFEHFPYSGSKGTSLFGSESIDLVRVEVPEAVLSEPGLAGLLALAFASIMRLRRRMTRVNTTSP